MADATRDRLARELLNQPYAALSPVRRSVIDLIADEAPTSIGPDLIDRAGFWERLADRVAAVGGSWSFIFCFCAVLTAWVGVNLLLKPLGLAFDPYPFIFLNLVLSTVAAIQAPVIMMSQNRQAAKDRQSAEHDYIVNLRAELEIMRLHDRLDSLRAEELAAMVEANTRALEALRDRLDRS